MGAVARVLREAGVVRTDRDERVLAALRPAALAALAFPGADRRTHEILALTCATWAFYDDALEVSGRPDPDVSLALRRGRAPTESDPIAGVFARIGRALGASATRFADAFDATVATVVEEAVLRSQVRRATLARYLRWRRPNIGLDAMLALMEHARGIRLDPAVRAEATPWLLASTDVFLAINDRASLLKDGPGGLNLATFGSLPEFHRRAAVRAIRADRALRARRPRDAPLHAWLDGGSDVLGGFAAWYARAPRYATRPSTADRSRSAST